MYTIFGENTIATTKIRNNYAPSKHSFFQYCDSNIGLFSIAPCIVKLSLLSLFAPFLVSVLCFFFDGFLSKAIALPTIAISIVVALKGDSEKN